MTSAKNFEGGSAAHPDRAPATPHDQAQNYPIYIPPAMSKRSLQSNASIRELKKLAETLPPSEDGENARLRLRMLLGRQIMRWKYGYRH